MSKDPSKILISPNNATKTEGENVTFACNFEGKPLSTVTWWNGAVQINTSSSRYHTSESPSSVVNSTSSLSIIGLTRSDEGFYRCKVDNDIGSEQSNAAYLTVNCKFHILHFAQKDEVK